MFKKALFHHELVLMTAMTLAYSTMLCNPSMAVISFEVEGHKTTITKSSFYKLLGLSTGESYLNPE